MYNSMYGSSLGSYGSTYDSYGASGSLGGSYGMPSTLGPLRNQQMQGQNNNQNQPQQNQRRKVFQEYFKMMGGMRSILELGFAGVAFVNFGSRSWEMIKKIFLFLFKTSSSFLSFVSKFIPVEQIKNIVVSSTGSSGTLKWQNLIITLVRITMVAVLAITYKLRNGIKKQVFDQHKQLMKKADQIQKKKQNINKNMQKYIEENSTL